MKFSEIRQIPSSGYQVDVPWDSLQEHLNRFITKFNLELNPEFQRGHVWNESQQIKYIEFILMNGESGRDIYFNCPGWMDNFEGPMTLVDGLQRITAVMKFLDNEIKAFGHYLNEFEGRLPFNCSSKFHINKINDYNELLQWYIDLNSGVAHTSEELGRVRSLMK